MKKAVFYYFFAKFIFMTSIPLSAHAETCAGLAEMDLRNEEFAHAKIVSSIIVKKGYVSLETAKEFGGTPEAKMDFCRVIGVVGSDVDSAINFEVWMPVSSWNGKFQGTGNGGFYGALHYPQMMRALNRGYAVAGSDLGHQSENIQDGSWALEGRTKLEDFSHRADHLVAVAAKKIVSQHYGSIPTHSYFFGCSYGGRQGLVVAQRHPQDYDGVVAIAPGIDFPNIMANINWYAQLTMSRGGSSLSADNLSYIHKKVVEVCDVQDGLKDGLISDPISCVLDVDELACSKESGKGCLDKERLDAVKAIYQGPRHSVTGESIYPGMMKGSELEWDRLINGTKPSFNDAFSIFAFKDRNWDWRSFSFGDDFDRFRNEVSFLGALSPDLSGFKERDGKILIVHGLSDGIISARDSIEYQRKVKEKFSNDTDGFMRLFLAPGMGHCGGGNGPNEFDALSALEDWVEKGVPPDVIIAKKHLGNDPSAPVLRTRPLCKYKEKSRYVGAGSIDHHENFVCE